MKKLVKINKIIRNCETYPGCLVNLSEQLIFLETVEDVKKYRIREQFDSFMNYKYVQLIVTHQGTIKTGDYFINYLDDTICKSTFKDHISNDKIIGIYPKFTGIPSINTEFVKEWLKKWNPFVYAEFEINQCDGCYINEPDVSGIHHIPYPSGSMVCCKEKYNYPIIKDDELICFLNEKTQTVKEIKIDAPNPVKLYWYSKFIKDIDNLFID